MKLEHWFPTGIWHDNLDIDNDELKKFCLDEEIKTDSVKHSNVGGWQSSSKIIFNKSFDKLRNDVLEKSKIIHSDLRIRKKLKFEIANGWININRESDSNKTHVHAGADLSCCYYVDVPDGDSPIIFEDPRTMRTFSDDGKYDEMIDKTFECCLYTPTNGKIILFPSWLSHSVEPTNSTEPRISIAINLTLTPI